MLVTIASFDPSAFAASRSISWTFDLPRNRDTHASISVVSSASILPLDQLDDTPALEVDRWDEHYVLTGTPLSFRYVFRSPTACSEKWKTEAARAASA